MTNAERNKSERRYRSPAAFKRLVRDKRVSGFPFVDSWFNRRTDESSALAGARAVRIGQRAAAVLSARKFFAIDLATVTARA